MVENFHFRSEFRARQPEVGGVQTEASLAFAVGVTVAIAVAPLPRVGLSGGAPSGSKPKGSSPSLPRTRAAQQKWRSMQKNAARLKEGAKKTRG